MTTAAPLGNCLIVKFCGRDRKVGDVALKVSYNRLTLFNLENRFITTVRSLAVFIFLGVAIDPNEIYPNERPSPPPSCGFVGITSLMLVVVVTAVVISCGKYHDIHRVYTMCIHIYIYYT